MPGTQTPEVTLTDDKCIAWFRSLRIGVENYGARCVCPRQQFAAWYKDAVSLRSLREFGDREWRTMHLLIVDDDPATVDGLTELLESAGFQCEAARSYGAAIAAMRTSRPDVLVTDIRLAEYNGLQLVLNRPAGTAAIVMSGVADPVLESEAVRMGASYIRKPVQMRQLLALLNPAQSREG